MPKNKLHPAACCDADRARDCHAVPADTRTLENNFAACHSVEVTFHGGVISSVSGPAAKLLSGPCAAPLEGLRLSGSDLELAKTLGAGGLPLRIGRSDAKGRAYVDLDTTMVVEVRHGP
ncbi:hypothetical protein P6F26_05650 [Roseibacterium sp. SDUM158017]|uniref:hypothetical protein n=1 Tax=Roseicyclus salinarum TaxID=3036773 RepID=UPI002415543F|nr:hypothetical protein [Roseibacterium sp. SDUM158017]MDG4647921.1 hypothetical protein [Roseibacterium sp. SDUM158017]